MVKVSREKTKIYRYIFDLKEGKNAFNSND